MMYLIGQAFGLLGTLFNYCVYRQDDRRRLLFFKLLTDLSFTIQYALLGAWSGMAVAAIAALRACIFMKQDSEENVPLGWVLFFVGISVISGVVTWQGPRTLLATPPAILAIISFSRKDPRITRLLSLPISLSMLAYNIVVGSISGIINQLLTLYSSASKMIQERHLQKQ